MEQLLLLKDTLVRKDFKPWWEKIREYTLIPMFGAAFILAFSVNSGQYFHCISANISVNSFSGEQTSYINSACLNEFLRVALNICEVYAGVILIASTLIINLAFSWWYFVPVVKRRFAALGALDDEVRDGLTNGEKIQELSRRFQLKKSLNRTNYKKLRRSAKRHCIVCIYNFCNISAGLVTVASGVVPMVVLLQNDSDYECSLVIILGDFQNTVCTEAARNFKTQWICVYLSLLAVNLIIAVVKCGTTCMMNDRELLFYLCKHFNDVDETTSDIIASETGPGYSPEDGVQVTMGTSNTQQQADNDNQIGVLGSHEANKSIGFLADGEYEEYLKLHQNYFKKYDKAKVGSCGCDVYEFDLLETDEKGCSLLYYLLRKQQSEGSSDPHVRTIYHVLYWATTGVVISGNKLVRYKGKCETISDFLTEQHTNAEEKWKFVREEIEKCTDGDNFRNFMEIIKKSGANTSYKLKLKIEEPGTNTG